MVLLHVALLSVPSRASVDFKSCLLNVTQDCCGPIGLNSLCYHVNASEATAISYENCLKYCGVGQEPFQWTAFSQQFSSWLLPWLALISQTPFGSNDKLYNLEAMLLTVGSPTLGAYSLALTALNGRWLANLFSAYRYPNVRNAIRVLSSLQQSPLRVNNDEALLASLIVLPENDGWWDELVVWLDYTYSWSISAATSIAWVAIAYVFTVVDSFTSDFSGTYQMIGQGVGSLWLWLIPIVIGWLQISPQCDSIRLRIAMKRANRIAYVVEDSTGDIVPATAVSGDRAIYLDFSNWDTLRVDEQSTAPIYNYARFLPWIQAVEKVSNAYSAASRNAQRHKPVQPLATWVEAKRGQPVHRENRMGGSSTEISQYCGVFPTEEDTPRRMWGGSQHAFLRMLVASGLALMLQWGTTGAAVVAAWFTPTRGLGCRSSSYLVYGILSTIVWFLLVVSSILSHYATIELMDGNKRRRISRGTVASTLAILLRRAGKFTALINAIWIVVSCTFQFTNFYDTCYCNSNVLGLRSHAYNVISLTKDDLSEMRFAWSGGVGLAGGLH
ncbi:hypothetical protein BDQ17DRAFT_1250080 [Cyathus striatus]|nr:hypothetical protein BDQ17DRAFT_1250080 [Cyathus striatus]